VPEYLPQNFAAGVSGRDGARVPLRLRRSAPHDAREDGAYPVRSFEGDLCQENPPRQTFPFISSAWRTPTWLTVTKHQRH